MIANNNYNLLSSDSVLGNITHVATVNLWDLCSNLVALKAKPDTGDPKKE